MIPTSSIHHKRLFFHEILRSRLPEKEKGPERLWQDGQVMMTAGTLTTAVCLFELTYHLLKQPLELKKLKTELTPAILDPQSLSEISKLE
jgi:hypothetical protein